MGKPRAATKPDQDDERHGSAAGERGAPGAGTAEVPAPPHHDPNESDGGRQACDDEQLERVRAERLGEFLRTNKKQFTGQTVNSMAHGLTEQVTEIAQEQKATNGKLERVGTAISEVRERLMAAESREKEGHAKIARSASRRYRRQKSGCRWVP